MYTCIKLEKKRKVYAVRRHGGSLCLKRQLLVPPTKAASLQTSLLDKQVIHASGLGRSPCPHLLVVLVQQGQAAGID